MRIVARVRTLVSIFAVITVVYAVRTNQSHGRFLGVPFEFRLPTLRRVKKRWWNPEDERVFTPHVFGVGWSINIPQAMNRLGLREDES